MTPWCRYRQVRNTEAGLVGAHKAKLPNGFVCFVATAGQAEASCPPAPLQIPAKPPPLLSHHPLASLFAAAASLVTDCSRIRLYLRTLSPASARKNSTMASNKEAVLAIIILAIFVASAKAMMDMKAPAPSPASSAASRVLSPPLPLVAFIFASQLLRHY